MVASGALPIDPRFESKTVFFADDPSITGWHGYSNSYKEMWPFFVAIGPEFKQDYLTNTFVKEDIESVDLYNLMCHLLQISPATNDGNFDRIKHVLKDNGTNRNVLCPWIFVIFLAHFVSFDL